jgi:hypothetical protein
MASQKTWVGTESRELSRGLMLDTGFPEARDL